VAELFSDLELDCDEPYRGTCGECVRCSQACPTAAIVAPGSLDANRCISYLTIENKSGIPFELRSQMHDWVFGCDVCQEVCPYNQSPPPTPWKEFRPESGVGHYLDLLALLQVESEGEFQKRFGETPLRRPKRRGLLRNALVVLGNQLAQYELNDPARVRQTGEALAVFHDKESDEMLREHASWALSQRKGPLSAN
jgi:epoxyqueuosine reductase